MKKQILLTILFFALLVNLQVKANSKIINSFSPLLISCLISAKLLQPKINLKKFEFNWTGSMTDFTLSYSSICIGILTSLGLGIKQLIQK